MENRGDEPTLISSAFHYGTNPPFSHQFITRNQQAVAGGKLANYHGGFHDYAVEWHADQVRFYVDDVHHATIRDAETGGLLSRQTAGMKLIMNTAVGGDSLDNPDASTVWPQDFSIDHVYAYTIAADEPVLTFENGFFDARGGTLVHWSTFGNSIGARVNVRGDNLHRLSGDGSLKLYGQFNGQENYSGVEQGITVRPGDELLARASAFIASTDSIVGTDNYALLKIDYYSTQYAAFGSADYLGSDSIVLADGTTLNDQWLQQELVSIVPDGAVEARLALNFVQPGSGGGAVHIDNVSFYVVAIPEPSTLTMLSGLALAARIRRPRRAQDQSQS